MRIEVCGRSETGLIRTRNEDAFGLWPEKAVPEASLKRAFFAVADGMGGHPGGAVASQVAIAAALETARRNERTSPRSLLERVHLEAALRVRTRAEADPRHREMGTTLTTLLVDRGRAYLGHVGDTRLYWIRGEDIWQLTVDHTVAQDLVASGQLDALAAEVHPMSNVLTRCLGVCPDQRMDLLAGKLLLQEDDCLLLASDGLIKTMPSEHLPEVVQGRSADQAVQLLLEEALQHGAPDNVTVVLVRVLVAEELEADSSDVPFDPAHPLRWHQALS